MSELPKSVSDAITNAAKDELGDHCWPFIRGTEWLWNFLSEGAETLPEIYNSCAHPQVVWFETHWRPIFAKQMARIAAAELKNAQNMSRRQEAEHMNALLERENAALREAVLGSDWNIPRADLLKPADRIRAARKSPNSGETLPKVGECTCATTKTTCPVHLTPYPEER